MTDLPTSVTGKTPLDVARACVRAAGELMRAGFGTAGVSLTKGRGNVMTEVDLAVERATIALLAAEYPAMPVLAEETAATTPSDGWVWVVDPVDGTKNFSRGIPHFCFTIALCHDGEPRVGLTYQPVLDEEFAAVAGKGVTLNGQPVTVSSCRTVRDAIVAIDLGFDDARGRRQLELALQLWPGMEALRIPGSAALGVAWVACGRWDLFLHSALNPWDIAAGLLFVREAGGLVSDRDGGRATIFSEGIVAGAPAVHDDFLRLAGEFRWR